jgi:O-antigen ligase
MIFRFAQFAFLVLVFSLGFMQPSILFRDFRVPLTDFIFLFTFFVWLVSILLKKSVFHWHKFYWLLLGYFGAMLLSTFFSINPQTSFVKLLGEIYLLSLPVLSFNLIRTENDIKRVLQVWLLATSFVVLVGILTFFLFYFDRENWLLRHTLFYYGTLPPGNYPRIAATFWNGNMLCNYLSVSLIFLLISQKLGWITKSVFYPLLFGILFCSFLTISPGLGGIALVVGIWGWLYFKQSKPRLAFASLVSGVFFAAVFLPVMMIAPNTHPTSPFSIKIPFIGQKIEPSSRAMVWMDSWATFAENPLVGRGLGQDVCNTQYLDLSGRLQLLTDAHNVFLNVAAQTGIFGLLAIIFIIFYVARKTFPLNITKTNANILKIGFGTAFIGAFVYQGIGGAFEDARHLWVLIGLFLVSESLIDRSEQSVAHFSGS